MVVITGVNITLGIVYTNNPWYFAGKQTFGEFRAGVAWYFPTRGMPLDGYMFVN